jgi:hypothetical protein
VAEELLGTLTSSVLRVRFDLRQLRHQRPNPNEHVGFVVAEVVEERMERSVEKAEFVVGELDHVHGRETNAPLVVDVRRRSRRALRPMRAGTQ